jgi:hypothetical protein
MTATVLILPVIRRESDDAHLVQMRLGKLDAARLRNRANEWGVTEGEAAVAIISEALNPRRRG